jgi:hypothetical protein
MSAHVSDNFVDVEVLHEFDHLWQLSTAGAVRVFMDEESAILSLQSV